jgi:TRAP transporter TAXI family solute receptor
MSNYIRRICALTFAASMAVGATAWAQSQSQSQSQVDPAAVSEGLKAISRYGSSTRETADKLNANTVMLVTGTIGGTYVQIGADLASVLDDRNDLRIVPIVGRGSVQSIADILFMKGVDLGIVRSDTLDYLEKTGYASNIKRQLAYITKLYNEEMHVLAPKRIRSLAELNGRTVSVGSANGGTFITAQVVFERLGIKPNFVYIEQRVAYEKLRNGEIDAMVAVQGRPSKFFTTVEDERFHLVPVHYAKPLRTDYLPAQLTSDDYPWLIAPGQVVDTIAVSAVLAAYNAAPGSDRYRNVERFVEAFFGKIEQLQQPPFHPKWKEVALAAPVPGWERFRPAQDWLNRNASVASVPGRLKEQFEQFLAGRRETASVDADSLFRHFLQWREQQERKR